MKAQLQPPKVSSDDLKKLGIVEQVSTFTTQFPYNPPRTANIRLAAKTLDGTIVQPGETFSLNAALGQRTKEKGYQQAPVINGGRLTQDYGGGISQVSTTLFNAVFFAGLDSVDAQAALVLHLALPRRARGHDLVADGRPEVPQRLRPRDPHQDPRHRQRRDGVVLRHEGVGHRVGEGPAHQHQAAEDDPRHRRRVHRAVTERGFDVTVTRIFRRDGAQVRTEKFFTRYIPEDHVICG